MAGRETIAIEAYNNPPNESSPPETLDELSLAFCGDVRLIESRFLCVAWLSPRRMHDVACDVGLTAAAFAYAPHSLMFCYLGRAVEADILDRISMNDCAARARKLCLAIDANEWLNECLSVWAACDGDASDELEELARAVNAFAARREEAQAKLGEVAALLKGDPSDYDDLLRRGRRKAAVVPSRIRRQKRRRHATTV